MPDIECSRCVLRWRYHAGNNWGCDSSNVCGIGEGHQEEFVNCADIQIYKGEATPTPEVVTIPTLARDLIFADHFLSKTYSLQLLGRAMS